MAKAFEAIYVSQPNWFDLAARQGEYNSQIHLAFSYDLAYGIRRDHDKAYLWLLAAKDNEHKNSSIKWYKEVTGVENNIDEFIANQKSFYSKSDINRLTQKYKQWRYDKELPVAIIRIRDIPYFTAASIITPAIRPCFSKN